MKIYKFLVIGCLMVLGAGCSKITDMDITLARKHFPEATVYSLMDKGVIIIVESNKVHYQNMRFDLRYKNDYTYLLHEFK